MSDLRSNPRLSEIRIVTLYFQAGTPRSHMMLASDVGTYVDAARRLHFHPGKNPHSGGETSKIWQITVGTLGFSGPYWWTVPDLQVNGDPRGARIIGSCNESAVWHDQKYVDRLNAEEDALDD